MTRYSDVQKTFASFRSAQNKYWGDLQDKVSKVTEGFSLYLGVGDTPSGVGPYVDFGKMQDGTFTPCHVRDLDARKLALEFVLKIVIEESPTKNPKEHLLIPLAVRRTQGFYEFEVENSQGAVTIPVSQAFIEEEQEELYDALLALTLDHYDPKVFA